MTPTHLLVNFNDQLDESWANEATSAWIDAAEAAGMAVEEHPAPILLTGWRDNHAGAVWVDDRLYFLATHNGTVNAEPHNPQHR